MPDLVDVLRQGADVTTGLPDMQAAWSRAVRVRRRRRLAASAAAAAVVAAVVAVAGAVVDLQPPTPPQPVVTPELVPAEPLPPYPGPLRAGRTYDAAVLGLPYRFSTMDSRWSLAAREPGWLSLHRGSTRLNIHLWDAVYDPAAALPGEADALEVPTDLVGWLTSHPRLDVRSQRTVVVAGDQWQVLEVSVGTPLTTPPPECGTSPCVLLGRTGIEPTELLASERALIHVPVDDTDRTVLVVAYPERASGPGGAASALIASLDERPLP